MKKIPNTLDDIKQRILDLKGKEVELYINRGRRRIKEFRATIEDVYSSVFTVKSMVEIDTMFTYSYNDILCGDVKITNDKEA